MSDAQRAFTRQVLVAPPIEAPVRSHSIRPSHIMGTRGLREMRLISSAHSGASAHPMITKTLYVPMRWSTQRPTEAQLCIACMPSSRRLCVMGAQPAPTCIP